MTIMIFCKSTKYLINAVFKQGCNFQHGNNWAAKIKPRWNRNETDDNGVTGSAESGINKTMQVKEE